MTIVREKFATQVRSTLLDELRSLAKEEGRQLQALVEEAIGDLLEKHNAEKPRNHVMEAYMSSHETYGELYKKLAE
ncbi:MAG: hypothetical protein DHS20C08_02020 [Rhodomicrobium sp.]|nr:MAG: hypothetical protein DHS20C08_02020 [Rhodomicrobium sp.]